MFAKIKKVFDGFLEILLTVVMTILVLDVVWQVFTRYILKDPSSWTEELATFLNTLKEVGVITTSIRPVMVKLHLTLKRKFLMSSIRIGPKK